MVIKLDWWNDFQKYAEALSMNKSIPFVVVNHILATKRLFAVLKDHRHELDTFSYGDVANLLKQAKQLLKEIDSLEHQIKVPKVRIFFHKFLVTIENGLAELELLKEEEEEYSAIEDAEEFVPEKWEPITGKLQKIRVQIKRLTKEFIILERKYYELSGVEEDSSPEIKGFMSIVDQWLKHIYGLEYSINKLHQNLDPELDRQIGVAMPLKFRVESLKAPHLFKCVFAKSSHVSRMDQTILDVISQTPDCHTRKEWNDFALRQSKIINFIHQHSEPGKNLVFEEDPESRLAAKLYQTFLTLLEKIQPVQEWVIQLINQTPLQDLEKAMDGIKAEDCRSLFRFKIQSMLPGLNDDRFRAKQPDARSMRSIRTTMLCNGNTRKFQAALKEWTGDIKSLLSFKLWLRKAIVSVLLNNQGSVKSRGAGSQNQEPTLNVPINLTLGDENITHYFVEEEDIISGKGGGQRSSKIGSWINVSSSESIHRINKQDFFLIIYDLCVENLNPATKKFGLSEIDFKKQLMPEINERIEDRERIEQIRSGMLGATIHSLKEYSESQDYHTLFRKYFQVGRYNQIQYPYREKFNLLANELYQVNPSILQIRFRKILTIQIQTKEKISSLSGILMRKTKSPSMVEFKLEHEFLQEILPDLEKILEILEFVRPTLNDIREEFT